jgi:hypothetical protein
VVVAGSRCGKFSTSRRLLYVLSIVKAGSKLTLRSRYNVGDAPATGSLQYYLPY